MLHPINSNLRADVDWNRARRKRKRAERKRVRNALTTRAKMRMKNRRRKPRWRPPITLGVNVVVLER